MDQLNVLAIAASVSGRAVPDVEEDPALCKQAVVMDAGTPEAFYSLPGPHEDIAKWLHPDLASQQAAAVNRPGGMADVSWV